MRISFSEFRWGILALTLLVAACGGSGEESDAPQTGSILSPPSTNHAPTISGAPGTTIAAGAAYKFTPTASDGDSDALIFGIDAKPTWASFDTATGALTGTPGVGDAGVYRGIIVWVSDGKGATQLPAFDLTVMSPSPTNRPPQISGTPTTSAVAGTAYSFTPSTSDPDGDTLSYTIANRPSWASFSATTGRLSGTPAVANAGTYANVTITVSDGKEGASLAPFTIVVDVPNRPPTISGTPPSTVEVGGAYSFTPTAQDADGDVLSFTVTGAPSWAAFDMSTGRLSGTPAVGNVGTTSNIQIRASDGAASAALAAFSITVTAQTSNRAPTISGAPPTTTLQGALYSFQPSASDPDNDALTFTIANKPSWATFTASTGRLQGTPGAANVGAFTNIVIGVTDGKASVSLPPFTLTVTSTNTPPTITGSPLTLVNAGTAYSFTPTANDVNGTALTFSIVNKPSWANFSTTTGVLSGTPAASDAGTFANIRISVTDGQDTANLAAFAVTVNRAPTISGAPGTQATIGSLYTFMPTASDPDGDTLTFTITNKPSWANFSTTTGRLDGTPPAGAANAAGIVIGVGDGKGGTATLPAFGITVAAANRAPSISGTPATSVTVGSLYTFTATGSDPDGDPLTFSINANKPAWATFTSGSGSATLTGTPPAGASGASGIVISVSDGRGGSASLAAFAITVIGLNGAPTITGSPPTSATVGTAYSFAPTANDPDGDTLTFSATGKPSWTSLSTTTGVLSGTPPAGATGAANVVISVSDGKGGSASLPGFAITMANRAPTLSGTPPTQVTAGAAYSFAPAASDPDGDTLTFSQTGKPSWATFNTSTGALSGAPTAAAAGTTSNIVISASDGRGGSATLPSFAITVVNNAPTISGSPPTSVNAGASYAFTPTASDPDPNPTLTFTISNKPSWATFTTTNGRLQGTPAAADAGSTVANITISVSDGRDSAALPAFTITVPNRAPTISGTPPTQVVQGTAYAFTPTASDPDGNPLSFSIVSTPAWASFNPANGRLTGTPGAGDVGTTSGIVISVSDGKGGSASLSAFAIAVQAVTTGSAMLTWVPPNQNTDGTSLVDLVKFKVYWGPAQGNYPSSAVVNNAAATSYLVDNLVPGTYFFVVTAINGQGVESQFSNVASKVIQ